MPIDPMEQRLIMGHFATGVTIVTTHYKGELHGMTANAVTSLSLEPPLVLVSVDCQANMNTCLKASECFAVNILTEDQEDLSTRFAKRARKISPISIIEPISPDRLFLIKPWPMSIAR